VINRRLLYLNTHRLTAYAWRLRASCCPEGVFEMRDEEHQRFADYLREYANSHFQMLANVAEEGHVLETIPFLQVPTARR
jgi:pantothenate kinase-related protein Tda10